MFDKNGDQKISETELYEVMCYLGVKTTQEECKAMIRVVDKNSKALIPQKIDVLELLIM